MYDRATWGRKCTTELHGGGSVRPSYMEEEVYDRATWGVHRHTSIPHKSGTKTKISIPVSIHWLAHRNIRPLVDIAGRHSHR